MRAHQNITHHIQNYVLSVNYNDEYLQLSLKVNKKPRPLFFEKILTKDLLVHELQEFESIKMLYEYFKNKYVFMIEEEGVIILQVTMETCEQKMIKLVNIILDQCSSQNISVENYENVPENKNKKDNFPQHSLNNEDGQWVKKIKKYIVSKINQQIQNAFRYNSNGQINLQLANRIVQLQDKIKDLYKVYKNLYQMIEIKDRKIQEMENNFFALHERVNDLSEFFCQLKENNIKEMLHTFNKVQKKKKIFEEPIVFKKVTKHWQKEVRNEKDQFITDKPHIYSINQKRIQYIGTNKSWNALLKNVVLENGKVYEFQFQIERSEFKNLLFGICLKNYSNYNFQKNSAYFQTVNKLQNIMGSSIVTKLNSIHSFNTIKMEVNLRQMTIHWVFSQKKVSEKEDIKDLFVNNSLEKVPFVAFFNENDAIVWKK